ncbi:MAG: hypothetical protein ACE5HV_17330, partial [Acidobacteriota bacterium]
MNFREIVKHFRDRPFFESREIVLLFDEPAPQVQARLSRWQRQGKLIQLRRGRYLLSEEYRRFEVSDFYIANYLHRPSYVSLQSALEYYDMIPEAVGMVLSLTTLHGRQWQTPAGLFRYRSIGTARFWGYREQGAVRAGEEARQRRFLIASPEKAVLDLFYLEPGDWTGERLEALRLQNLGAIDRERLVGFAEKFQSAKVQRAAGRLLARISQRVASRGRGKGC